MKSDIKICPHCSHNLKIHVSDDIVVFAHWVGKYYLIDIGLFFKGLRKLFVLYREIYVAEGRL